VINIFCGYCGSEHEENVKFCSTCGKPVAGVEPDATPGAAPSQEPQQQYAPMQPDNAPEPVQYSPDPYAAALQNATAPTGLDDTRAQLEKKYNISRNNLLAVIAFTVINIVLALLDTDLFFLFSASIPMYLLYWDSWYSTITGILTFSPIGVTAAFISIAIYGVFWWLTLKYKAWIIAALVYFSIDVLVSVWMITFLIQGFELALLIEIAFMVWIMYYLITGTIAWSKLRDLQTQGQAV